MFLAADDVQGAVANFQWFVSVRPTQGQP
jgi:hypothetical protein